MRRAPMLHYLSRRTLCDILQPGASLSDFAVKASPEDWRRQGHVMIQRNLYQQAEKCFQQSGDRLRASPLSPVSPMPLTLLRPTTWRPATLKMPVLVVEVVRTQTGRLS